MAAGQQKDGGRLVAEQWQNGIRATYYFHPPASAAQCCQTQPHSAMTRHLGSSFAYSKLPEEIPQKPAPLTGLFDIG